MIGLSFLDVGTIGFTQWADVVPAFDPPRSPLRVSKMMSRVLSTPRTFAHDTLEARVDSDTAGYLCFIDNWDPHWIASVNGQASPVICVLGTFKAVEVEPGESRVRFEYRRFD
jgi:hypothetical protein